MRTRTTRAARSALCRCSSAAPQAASGPQRDADLQRRLLRVQQAEDERQHRVEVVRHHLLAARPAAGGLHAAGLHLRPSARKLLY